MKVDTAASFDPLVITACGDWGTIATVELTDLALNHAKKCDEDSSSESGCAIEGRGSPAWNQLDCPSHGCAIRGDRTMSERIPPRSKRSQERVPEQGFLGNISQVSDHACLSHVARAVLSTT